MKDTIHVFGGIAYLTPIAIHSARELITSQDCGGCSVTELVVGLSSLGIELLDISWNNSTAMYEYHVHANLELFPLLKEKHVFVLTSL